MYGGLVGCILADDVASQTPDAPSVKVIVLTYWQRQARVFVHRDESVSSDRVHSCERHNILTYIK